jgi:hypothetical protein
MDKHVTLLRSLTVAASDDLIFSMKEFNHLKACPECFTTWTEFIIVQLVYDHEHEEKKTNRAMGRVLPFRSRKLG